MSKSLVIAEKEKLVLTGRNFSRTRLGERQPSVMTG